MKERVKLAGVEATIGIFVLGLFGVLGLLGVAGIAILLLYGKVHWGAQELGFYAAFVAFMAFWLWRIGRDIMNVRVVEIAEDGTWILHGVLGIPRGRIAPGGPRRVIDRSRGVWIFGRPRHYTQTWAEIVAGDRHWRTCAGTRASQGKAIDRLQALAAA